MSFLSRAVLGINQFFKMMSYNGELAKLAHRQARKQAVAAGLQDAELSADTRAFTESLAEQSRFTGRGLLDHVKSVMVAGSCSWLRIRRRPYRPSEHVRRDRGSAIKRCQPLALPCQ